MTREEVKRSEDTTGRAIKITLKFYKNSGQFFDMPRGVTTREYCISEKGTLPCLTSFRISKCSSSLALWSGCLCCGLFQKFFAVGSVIDARLYHFFSLSLIPDKVCYFYLWQPRRKRKTNISKRNFSIFTHRILGIVRFPSLTVQ